MRINIYEVLAKSQGVNYALEMIARDLGDGYVEWLVELSKNDPLRYRDIQDEINKAVEHLYRAKNKIEEKLVNDLRKELK